MAGRHSGRREELLGPDASEGLDLVGTDVDELGGGATGGAAIARNVGRLLAPQGALHALQPGREPAGGQVGAFPPRDDASTVANRGPMSAPAMPRRASPPACKVERQAALILAEPVDMLTGWIPPPAGRGAGTIVALALAPVSGTAPTPCSRLVGASDARAMYAAMMKLAKRAGFVQ